MIDDEKKAEIEARYRPLIKALEVKKDNAGLLATLMCMAFELGDGEVRAEAVAIEKITTVTPEPPPAAAVEVTRPRASSPPVIHLPHLVTSPIDYPFVSGSTAASSSGKQAVIGLDSETGVEISVGDTERCGGFYVLGEP